MNTNFMRIFVSACCKRSRGRFHERLFLEHVRPQVAYVSNSLGHRSQRKRSWPTFAPLQLFPGAGGRNGRTWLCADCVSSCSTSRCNRCGQCRPECDRRDRLAELLRQIIRITLNQQLFPTPCAKRATTSKSDLPSSGTACENLSSPRF
jgi:hypothetical protein